jgi:hypothetical protein
MLAVAIRTYGIVTPLQNFFSALQITRIDNKKPGRGPKKPRGEGIWA